MEKKEKKGLKEKSGYMKPSETSKRQANWSAKQHKMLDAIDPNQGG